MAKDSNKVTNEIWFSPSYSEGFYKGMHYDKESEKWLSDELEDEPDAPTCLRCEKTEHECYC
jgi:hypothetical protein